MKYILSVSIFLISSLSLAGTLTIVPDNTSSLGLQQQQREVRAQRQARIAAGVERAPSVIIIKQAPKYQYEPKTNFNCRSYGYQNSQMSCY